LQENFPEDQLKKFRRKLETHCATHNLRWNLQSLKAFQKLLHQTKDGFMYELQ